MKNGRKLLAASMASVMAMSSVSGTLLSNIGTVAFADAAVDAAYADLQSAITNAEKVVPSQFTTETYNALAKALKEAKAITKSDALEDIKAAEAKLTTVLGKLKTHLDAAFDAYEKISKGADAKVIADLAGSTLLASLDETYFYEIAHPEVDTVRNAYEASPAAGDKTVEEWNKAKTELIEAIEFANANITLDTRAQVKAYAALQAEIVASKELTKKQTEEPDYYLENADWSTFTTKLGEAEAVAANAGTTTINNAAKALKDARAKVVTPLQAALKALNKELDSSKTLYNRGASAYSDADLWKDFSDKYLAAKALTNSTEKQKITDATGLLTTARTALAPKLLASVEIKELEAKKKDYVAFFDGLTEKEWAKAKYDAFKVLKATMVNADNLDNLRDAVGAFKTEYDKFTKVIKDGSKNGNYADYRSVGFKIRDAIKANAAYNNDFYAAMKGAIKDAEDGMAAAAWDDQTVDATLLTGITSKESDAKAKKNGAADLEASIDFAKDYMSDAEVKLAVATAELTLANASKFNEVADDFAALKTAIDDAVKDAMKVKAVDEAKAELTAAVKASKGYVESDYEAKYWNALVAAVEANDVDEKLEGELASEKVYTKVDYIETVTENINKAIKNLVKTNKAPTVADAIADIKALNTSSVSAVAACAEKTVAAIKAATSTTKIQEKAAELLQSTKLTSDDMVKVLKAIALEADTTKPAPTRLAVVQAYTSLSNDGSAVNQLYLAAQGMNKTGAATVTRLDLVQVYQSI